jgi:dTDP-glucose pyrophosphorylase
MDCTVIILAGGQGVRLGRLGQLTSKALLVTYDRPLLIRHLDQLVEANFRQIVISTNPTHHPSIHALVNSYHPEQDAHIHVLENPAHLIGPIEALYEVVKRTETRRCLMVLVDEFVRGNSFVPFVERVAEDEDYTAIAPVIDSRELGRGGYVRVSDSRIEAFIERAEAESGNAFPSPGTSLFSTQPTLRALENFLSTAAPGASVGDFYNFRCRQGHAIHALMGTDFVNINTPDYLLLATLYAAIEAHQSDVLESLTASATILRNKIAQSL